MLLEKCLRGSGQGTLCTTPYTALCAFSLSSLSSQVSSSLEDQMPSFTAWSHCAALGHEGFE